MKNTRALWMLLASALLGLAVVVMVADRVSQPAVAANKVIVANIDLELGSKLNPQMLSVIDWPQSSMPAGTFSDLKDLQDRILKTSVQRGEAILNNKLAPLGSLGGLSAVIADGKRAMTVRVNDVVGVAGFALPGNYVDILVNAHQDMGKGSENKSITKTVLEHVLVLAVAQEAGRDDTKPRLVNAVTLELTPAEAEKIDLARNVGTLSLVLRNQIDKASIATLGIREGQLFGDEPLKKTVEIKPITKGTERIRHAPLVAAAKKDCVEVIQEGARSLHCF
ncbi:MAG TPA: Flp pilus assembly protein CpaB [Herbaspirillum sp.]|jgi:pilus assembly protein CpaB|nr:Flp pilus assembly protein CpaB [Herbaspirillum sp.]